MLTMETGHQELHPGTGEEKQDRPNFAADAGLDNT
jgi:hypothetical protein